MLKKLKYILIKLFDLIDIHILKHRFLPICLLISESKWWDIENK